MAYQATIIEEKLRKGPWLDEEDKRLTAIVTLLGERRWDTIARATGLKRSGKSCRLRWLNYLRPNLKHDPISPEEEQIIFQLHQQWGNKWSRIARRLPGRTDNEIKNYWRTHLRKKAQIQEQGNFPSPIDIYSQGFLIQKSDERASFGDCKSDASTLLGTRDDFLSSSNFAIANSPFESRLSDWMLGLPDHQSGLEYSSYCSYCSWSSEEEENSSIWDCSGSLWNLDWVDTQ